MAPPPLTAGICARLNDEDPSQSPDLWGSGPTVQVLSLKKVQPNPSAVAPTPDRYRIIISDGVHFLQAMLSTPLNHLVDDNIVTKYSVVRLPKITCNIVQGRRLVIILELEVLDRDCEKIGNPASFGQTVQDSGAPPAVPESNPAQTAFESHPTAVPPAVTHQKSQQVSSRSSSRNIYPIESLNPYGNNWTIRARVTRKSDIRTYSNSRGEGKVFNATFMDESGEIQGTAFNNACDVLYDRLQEGKVYYISKARVNLSKKQFSKVANDYELGLERTTEIEECLEQSDVPMQKYNFVDLSALDSVAKDAIIDVVAVVKDASEPQEIQTKFNRPTFKRDLTLLDKSGFSVRMTLWGKLAETWNIEDQSVVAFKGVKVGDFQGRTLSTMASSQLAVNPDIPPAYELRGWYDAVGNQASFQSHTNSTGGIGGGASFNRAEIQSLVNVKQSQLGMSEKGDTFSTKATIMYIKEDNLSYPSCPKCHKKVFDQGDSWRCEKCDASYPKPEHRYLMSMAVADWSGQAWLQGFNEVGNAVFGMTADQLVEIRDTDPDAFKTILQKANCATFNFACRAKQDTYNDNVRTRYGISQIYPLKYQDETKALLEQLSSPWAQ